MNWVTELDSRLAFLNVVKYYMGCCHVSRLPTSLARRMQTAHSRSSRPPPAWTLVSASAIWPPSPPMIPEHVSDNGHRSGKWTSGAPVQHTLIQTPQLSQLPLQRVHTQGVFVCDDLAVMRGEARDHWDLTTGSPTNWPTIWIETTALLSALAPSFRLFSPSQPASRHAPHLPKYSSLQ